jgi:hypothetical protein
MTADALFETRDWRVCADGLEHKPTGYFIGRGQIADRRSDGLWSWPAHMAEKTWVRPEPFLDAFAGALRAFGMAPDASLAASFAAGIAPAERDGRWPPPAGPDAIRVPARRSEAAEEFDLPAWALPDGGTTTPYPMASGPFGAPEREAEATR